MFFRQKKSGDRVYLQIVENRWEQGQSKQRVIATLGRLDRLRENGQLDALLQSGARFSESVLVLAAHRQRETPAISTRRIGPALVFGRLWEQLQIPQVIRRLLADRRLTLPVERIVFLSVLHRLFVSGSDRSCLRVWKREQQIPGTETIALHQVYRAMAWLGEYGHSKDHRPDRKQMIVGVVLDGDGRPLCCELWPGNVTDVRTLIPIVDRLRKRFQIRSICVVADRGMISKETMAQLQADERKVHFILGARLRNVKQIYETVLSRGGRYRVVHEARRKSSDPSPLKVKEVRVEDHRYVVCLNNEQAKKDRADREAIVSALREQVPQGAKSMVGNKGYRKYLQNDGQKFQIDEAKVKQESRFDGKWVLQTDLDQQEMPAEEVALKYKQLWMVEEMFRTAKTLLETRPIYHHCDETIRGHVFCSFLALVLRKELHDRLALQGNKFEWAEILLDLQALQYVEVEQQGKKFLLRSEVQGTCNAVLRAAGVAIPPTVQKIKSHTASR